jgi:hypothetical protein
MPTTDLSHESLAARQLHPPFPFDQTTDPVLDVPNIVQAGDLWLDRSSGPPFRLWRRNAANTTWQGVGSAAGAAQGTSGARPAASSLNANTLYYETDTQGIFFSDGASWSAWTIIATAGAHNILSASHGDTLLSPAPIDGQALVFTTSGNKWFAGLPTCVVFGLAANRPVAAAANEGMLYYEYDFDAFFWSDGAAWNAITLDYGQLTGLPSSFTPSAHDHDSTGAGHGGILTNDAHDGYSQYDVITTPSTPAAGKGRVYFKTVSGASRFHYVSDDGQEFIVPDPTSGAPTAATYVTGAAEAGLSAELVLGASVIMRGLFAGQPVPTTTGVIWIETDTEKVMRWNGSGFDEVFGHPGAHDHDGTTAGHGGKLSGAVVDTFMELEEQGGNPSTPAANKARFFAKDVSGETRLFYVSDSANVYELGTVGPGGSGAPATANYLTGSAQSDLTSELVLGTGVIMRGATGSRPAASLAGLLFIDTTTGLIYRDNSATWDEIARAENATRLGSLAEKNHASLTSVGINDHHNKAHDHTAADGSGATSGDEHSTFSEYTNIAAPATPSAGKTRIYISTGKHLHVKDDAGVDLDLSSGADPTTTAGDMIIRDASNVYNRLPIGSVAKFLRSRGGTPIPTWEYDFTTLNFVISDGTGAAITTGVKGDLTMHFAGTIVEADLLADQSGSVVVDIWKCTYTQFDAGATHPVAGDKITASAPPTITTATKSQDTTLTGWTVAFAAGDILRFNVNSCTTITRVTLALKVRKD